MGPVGDFLDYTKIMVFSKRLFILMVSFGLPGVKNLIMQGWNHIP